VSRPLRCVAVLSLALLVATVGDAAARGGRGGGGRGFGGGGFSRGGGGFSRGGAAAGGSLGHDPGRIREGAYGERGPAAEGDFGGERRGSGEEARRAPEDWEAGHEERQERRQERQDQRDDWHDYADDSYGNYDEYYGSGYYPYETATVAGPAAGEVLATPPWWTLDCSPPVEVGGTTYYECESAWYARVYHNGEVAYATVNPPPGH
jgi:hypothetical protein